MTERHWGEAHDHEAAKQLGLSDDHTIFMMGSEADYAGDIRDAVTEFADMGLVDATEVIEAVEEHVRAVRLPKGFALVGMRSLHGDGPEIYGVVDFTMFGRG